MKKIYMVLGIMFIMLLVACGIKTQAPAKPAEAEDINMKVGDKIGEDVKDTQEEKGEVEGIEPESEIKELESTDNNKPKEDNSNIDNEESIDTSIESQVEEITFIDCDEVVYAISTVNLRSGPSTDYDKVGSLSVGDSVTRTGIGTGAYENWSRVILSDGTEVYVSSKYVSTTKPAAQQTTAKPSGGTTTTTSKPSGGTTQSTGTSQSGSNQQWTESRGQGLAGLKGYTQPQGVSEDWTGEGVEGDSSLRVNMG